MPAVAPLERPPPSLEFDWPVVVGSVVERCGSELPLPPVLDVEVADRDPDGSLLVDVVEADLDAEAPCSEVVVIDSDPELAISEVVAAGLDLLVGVSVTALVEVSGCVVRLWEALVPQSESLASKAFERSSLEQDFSIQGRAWLFILSRFFGKQAQVKSVREQPVELSAGRRHVICERQ
ncbi:hypothetical protein HC256_009656 [Beauveria bassiana]|nr:hypothetical protein HC256_009656 [Beauveria bassiana]